MTGQSDVAIRGEVLRRVSVRLLPFLFLLFVCNFLDRTNLAIAALQMNRDLHFSAAAYGLGAGVFFIGYALFEIPSNLILVRVGARRWIARIMITWGAVAAAMMFVRTPPQFYALRFLLGLSEAGFYPGVVYYLAGWFPAAERARALSRFMIAIPVSGAIGNPLSASLLSLDGRFGLAGWQWLFLLEGVPSILFGVLALAVLTDGPEQARWLSAPQREWLISAREKDIAASGAHNADVWRALADPVLRLATVVYFLVMITNYSYAFWAPTLIRDVLHSSNVVVGWVTGLIAVPAIVAMLVVGARCDRSGDHGGYAGVCIIASAIGCLGVAVVAQPIARVASLAMVFIGIEGFLSPFWCIPSSLFGGSAGAAGIALVNSVGNIGGVVGPYAVGLVQDATGGIGGAFLVLALLTLVGAALCFRLRRAVSRQRADLFVSALKRGPV